MSGGRYPKPLQRRLNVDPTEAADGTPHLAYFAEGVSFVWSGNAEHPIQVCPGGYGEPVADTVWFDPEALDLPWVLTDFRRRCDRWLTEHDH